MALLTAASGLADDGNESGSFIPLEYQAGAFDVELIGRVNQDFTWADADRADGDFSESELRRLRVGLKGGYGESLKYKIETNIAASGDITVTDAYLKWKADAYPLGVQIGHFKTPNSLDQQTSSRFTGTLERAAFVTAFGFDRRVGVGVFSKGKNYTIDAGVFGETLEEDAFNSGYALAARGTFNPLMADGSLIHLGASVRYREASGDADLFRYSQRPYSHQLDRILATPRLADSDFFAGLEAAAMHERFWAAGEYGRLKADCGACAENPDLYGLYLEGGVFFGGRRDYKHGQFKRPEIYRTVFDGGLGGASLVLRYDRLDLSDGGVNGGDMDTYIAGAEWWPVEHAKIALNYFHANADLGDTALGLGIAFADILAVGATSENVNGLSLRLQLDL